MSAFYQFYLNMWIMRRIDTTTLQSKVPARITQDEYNTIISTPQVTQ